MSGIPLADARGSEAMILSLDREGVVGEPWPGRRIPSRAGIPCVVLSLVLCWPLAAATVTARVEITDSREAPVRARKDFSGVVVWLERADGPAPPGKPVHVTMTQKNKRFEPRILAVPVGSTVDMPNLDPIFHNAFSNFDGQTFDVGLYPPGSKKAVPFKRPGIVRVFCNIHPTMSAVIVVMNTPYLAISSRNGNVTFANVASGSYRVKVFHERAMRETLDALERTVPVGSSEISLGAIAISEKGYIPTPHKNKHGKDYPPVIVDTPAYSGRRP